MARRGASLDSIIRLGENPDFADASPFGGDEEEDEFGDLGDGMGSMDDEEQMAYKGRRVNGPRTKLSASLDAVTLAKGQRTLQKQIGQLAQSVNFLARIEKSRVNKHDPMGGGDPMGGEDPLADPMGGGGGYPDDDPMGLPGDEDEDEMQLDLSAGPQLRATGEGTNLNVRKARVSKAQLQQAAAILRKSGYSIGKVSKDDAATSFGEKDSNVTGNRPVDTESVGEDDTVIQGGPGAGPGPVSKSGGVLDTQSMISKAVADEFARYGMKPAQGASTVMKSTAPAVGGISPSQIGKGNGEEVDLGNLFDTLKDRSFHEINAIRVQMGDLSGGVI